MSKCLNFKIFGLLLTWINSGARHKSSLKMVWRLGGPLCSLPVVWKGSICLLLCLSHPNASCQNAYLSCSLDCCKHGSDLVLPLWWYTSTYLGVCLQVWREYNKAHKNWIKHQRLIRKALRHYKQDLRLIRNALKHQKTSQELHMGYSLWWLGATGRHSEACVPAHNEATRRSVGKEKLRAQCWYIHRT